MAEQRFDFLRELVRNVPDISLAEEAAANYNDDDVVQSSPEQDSYSDAASEYNNKSSSSLMDFNQFAATSSSVPTSTAVIMDMDTPLDMRKNNRMNDNDSATSTQTIRCTRSMKYYDKKPQRKCYDVEQQQQQQCITNSSTPKASTVIMHTNSIKLLRTESIPNLKTNSNIGDGGAQCTSAKRARQQKIAATCTSESASSSTTGVVDATVTAPILNFDFSSEPLVKIDYRNLAKRKFKTSGGGGGGVDDYAANKSTIVHSAPACVAASQSVFDFSQSSTPNISINIDLSSININAVTNIKPAVAAAAAIVTNNNKPKAAIDSKLINTSRPNIPTIPNATLSSTKANALLELDEDYDNI